MYIYTLYRSLVSLETKCLRRGKKYTNFVYCFSYARRKYVTTAVHMFTVEIKGENAFKWSDGQ